VFAALSQLEREQLKHRQREDIEIAKAQGNYTGRKPICQILLFSDSVVLIAL
jgi:DNA invertase Pin-like site-specific DNA recombinase